MNKQPCPTVGIHSSESQLTAPVLYSLGWPRALTRESYWPIIRFHVYKTYPPAELLGWFEYTLPVDLDRRRPSVIDIKNPSDGPRVVMVTMQEETPCYVHHLHVESKGKEYGYLRCEGGAMDDVRLTTDGNSDEADLMMASLATYLCCEALERRRPDVKLMNIGHEHELAGYWIRFILLFDTKNPVNLDCLGCLTLRPHEMLQGCVEATHDAWKGRMRGLLGRVASGVDNRNCHQGVKLRPV